MRRRFGFLQGLRARIAMALLGALLLQFVGGEIIFARVEDARMERGRSQRLADWLLFADEFIDARPDAVARMNDMWHPRLRITRHDAPPAVGGGAVSADREIARRVIASQPRLAPLDLHAVRDGDALHGTIRLSHGGWLSFRSEDYFQGYPYFYHYTASVLSLLVSVVLLALLFGRMIGRPLADIAAAAEHVGRDAPVAIAATGPREVRQVAAAFDRMQARLLDHVGERVQSLAAMSHDLRTPLARLRLNASAVDDAETRAALDQDIVEMEAFVTSVLDYLRGDEPEQEQWADLASIVMTVVDEARDAGGAVSYDGPDRLEGVTRPLKLKRLLRNIVQNGVRHAGPTRVRLIHDANRIVIGVDDDGPGIPEDKLDAVLKPFTRLETSRSRSTGGAGLGLAIAHQLSQRLGGEIALSNRSGGGLSVTMWLPFAPRQS
ncbi:MAG: hypothetical protein ABS87_01665 [Sphingomonas sp. SCN 67-18]|uniref:ATP-binding protein n=1 Tax=uncultured Sphingomonas sp. TaxID=158754 RepID=UPI00086C6D57|nr:ATP-binding protein [Sphingomonas sp. SCN 67-18]ODU22597.1 MAG: hypothetical protein ABS87_01665 [Sphingomonas sp. SCN 67-18]